MPATDFIDSFWSELGLSLINSLGSRSLLEPSIEKWLTAQTPTHFVALQKLLETLHLKIPLIKITLLIDEFDAIPQPAISPFLQTWRKIYLNSILPRPIHSVILIGLQNIAPLNLGAVLHSILLVKSNYPPSA